MDRYARGGLRLLLASALLLGPVLAPAASPKAGPSPIHAAVRAAERGGPWLSLRDGFDVETRYTGEADLVRVMREGLAAPLTLASADLDADAMADVVAAYATPQGGLLAVQRGHRPFLYPRTNEELQAERAGTARPFVEEAHLVALPVQPEVVLAGYFDADRHVDLVAASLRGHAFFLLAGDGAGSFSEPVRVRLPGRVTALSAGDVNRRDGLTDLVAGVAEAEGPRLYVFEGPHGILSRAPEAFDLKDEARSVATAWLDDDVWVDVVVAGGRSVEVIRGRDRRLTLSEAVQAEVPPAARVRHALGFAASALAVGDFVGAYGDEVAVVGPEGELVVLDERRSVRHEALVAARADALVAGRPSADPGDDLIMVDRAGGALHVLQRAHFDRMAEPVLVEAELQALPEAALVPVTLGVEGVPVAVSAARLNKDAQSDLVVLRGGGAGGIGAGGLSVVLTAPRATFVVNTDALGRDEEPGDGLCDIDLRPEAPGEQCTLTAAVQEANAQGGAAEIRFASSVYTSYGYFYFTVPVTIDGTVASGGDGEAPGRLTLAAGDAYGQTIVLTGAGSVVRELGLVDGRIEFDVAANAGLLEGVVAGGTGEGEHVGGGDVVVDVHSSGVVIGGAAPGGAGAAKAGRADGCESPCNLFLNEFLQINASGNTVEGNYLGLNPSGGDSPVNEHGFNLNVFGTNHTVAGNTGAMWFPLGTTGGLVQRNLIGVDATGTFALNTADRSGLLVDGHANTIGGPAGQGNVVSGGAGIRLEGGGNVVQGNRVGTDAAGTRAIPNGSHGINVVANVPAEATFIGGAAAGAGNVVSGNTSFGIYLGGLLVVQNVHLLGNLVGVGEGGQELGNGADGIFVGGYLGSFGAVRIGGTAPGEANVVAYNAGHGVQLRAQGTGVTLASVRVSGNRIHDNGGLGVKLSTGHADQAPTPNDHGSPSTLPDQDRGPNELQNYPELLLVSGQGSASRKTEEAKRLQVVLRSTPERTFRIELFRNAMAGCDASGHGEGEEFLEGIDVETDTAGYAEHTMDFLVSEDDHVTATATDEAGNTSEFSSCAAVPLIVVNDDGDEEDAGLSDGQCDVDPQRPENQCTLRAALQTANARPGADEIIFDLEGDVPVIRPAALLPPIEEAVTLSGNTGGATRVDLVGDPGVFSDPLPGAGLDVFADGVTIRGMGVSAFAGPGIRVTNGVDVMLGGTEEGQGNTIWENEVGVVVRGELAERITLQGNCIGAEDCAALPEENAQAGVVIEDGAKVVTIGGRTEAEGNVVSGGVHNRGGERVTVLGNVLHVPALAFEEEEGELLPFDVDVPGPACAPWEAAPGAGAGQPPPRLFSIAPGLATGIASRPGATVEVYRVRAEGTGRGRYFARHAEPVGHGLAGDDGRFSVALSPALQEDDLVTATATDLEGNTSELAQVRRPVILVPGIGGSNLEVPGFVDDVEMWLPDGRDDETQNDNLYRMRMNPDGTSREDVAVPTVLEEVGFVVTVFYGKTAKFLEANGFPGDAENDDPEGLDLWRFPYDWRLSIQEPAGGLQAIIDRVTGHGADVARSCEVDLVVHSMGNLVTAYYLKTEPEHAASRVHRFVSMAAPILGTPMAVSASTRGYIFGLEEAPLFGTGFDVDWGRMIEMTRNLPSVYALSPSRAYWRATGGQAYLQDFLGRWLPSYEATLAFVTGPKFDATGQEAGLDRNALLWNDQQAVHDLIDDWTGWQGPPHIFRLIGNRPQSTAVGWQSLSPRYGEIGSRREQPPDRPHDSVVHAFYRSTQFPVLGPGDGTVALVSARLGRGMGQDFSGSDGAWIEDFEEFACGHFPIMAPDCEGGRSVNRMLAILRGGYTVLPAASGVQPRVAAAQEGPQELVYVFSSRRVAVYVEDEEGHRTGPVDAAFPNKIAYEVPDVGYWPNDGTVVLSLVPGQDYEIEVVALEEPADEPADEPAHVQLIRMMAEGAASAEQLLFAEQALAPGGRMRWRAGGSAPGATVEVDADADGAFEASLAPAARLESPGVAPALPSPVPFAIDRRLLTGSVADQEVTLTLPGAGGPAWSWEAAEASGWIALSKASGTTPDSFRVVLAATGLAEGRHRDTLYVTLRQQGYAATYPVPVQLDITGARVLTSVEVVPAEVQLRPGEARQFAALGRDQLGDPRAFAPAWSAGGGTIDAAGLYTAGETPGTFAVTATDAATGLAGTATVEIVSGVAVEDESLPEAFRLHANYPNPFNPQTVIAYDVAVPVHVRLFVYDALGRQVRMLVDGPKAPGRYEAVFDASRLPSGVYVYRLEAGPYRASGRMVLLR